MPINASSHEENRTRVCLFCFKVNSLKNSRTKTRNITTANGKFEKLVQALLPNYNISRMELLSGICNTCYTKLYNSKNSLHLPDLTRFKPMKINTRSFISNKCMCALCIIARNNKNPKFVKGK